jgi:chromosome segregation ATPase
MSSCTPSCLDVDEATPAVVEWEHDGATHCFTKPDPKIDSIMLRIHLSGLCATFELRFPMNLKGVEGISPVTISVDPSSITSFDFAFASTAPEAVQEKFKCPVACLRFQTNKNIRLFVPTAAKEPLAPSRTQSGKVLDALRMLSAATSFGIYVDATKFSKAELQSISDAVKQTRLTSFHKQHPAASTSTSTESKAVDLSPQDDAPPAYDETGSPPPAPPINERKRRRISSPDEARDELAQIWAELKARTEKDRLVHQELSALRQENRSLRTDLDQLRQQVTTFREDFSSLQRDVEQLQGQDKHSADVLEGYDTRLIELRDDLEDLDAKVDSIQEHRDENGVAQSFLDRVRSDVYDDIVTRLTS